MNADELRYFLLRHLPESCVIVTTPQGEAPPELTTIDLLPSMPVNVVDLPAGKSIDWPELVDAILDGDMPAINIDRTSRLIVRLSRANCTLLIPQAQRLRPDALMKLLLAVPVTCTPLILVGDAGFEQLARRELKPRQYVVFLWQKVK